MKKIVVVCNSFTPDINPRSFRATELVKEFAKQKNDVLLLKPNVTAENLRLAEEFGFRIIDIGLFNRKPLVNFKGKFGTILSRAINRLLQLLLEYPDCKLFFLTKNAIKRLDENFDICLSIAVPYPIHWGTAAALSKNKLAKTWIADCGDPFMGDESDSFRHPFYFKYIEKYFCRRVNYLTVPTSNSYLGYYKEFWSKIRVIPQGFDFDAIQLAKNSHNFGCPSFGYAGGVIPNYREPFDFLDYLCTLKIEFKFIVYSGNLNYFEPYKAILGDKLILNQPKDRKEVLYEFSKLDFVINFDNKGSKQTASKLIDYYIIKKPILNLVFRQFNKSNFHEFLLGNYSDKFDIVNPEQYRISNVAKKFLDLA